MLSAGEIVERRDKPPPELPLIGTKDFEPDGSLTESLQIQHSLGQVKNIISYKSVKSLNTLSRAVWKPELHLAEVTHQTGSHWTHMGHKVGQQLYIYPEEALYLLETGALELMYNEVSLSVQRAYGVLLEEDSDVNIEKYRVYSLLSSQGYKVLRHSPQNTVTKYEKKIEVHKLGLKLKNLSKVESTGKRQSESEGESLGNKKARISAERTFPVVYDTGDDSADVLKRIQVIQPFVENAETALSFDFDVYSDTCEKAFRKSCLQLPTYRVIVHRGEDAMPDVGDLCKLSNKYADEVPVIHSVVFCDYIAFYRVNSVTLPDIIDEK